MNGTLVDTKEVSRVEVIDKDGRTYVNRNVSKVEISMQDNNRTLKLFID